MVANISESRLQSLNLKRDARLEDMLHKACEQAKVGSVAVAVIKGSDATIACRDHWTRTVGDEEFREDTEVSAACLSKTITTTFLAQAMARNAFDVEDDVAETVHKLTGRKSPALAGIKIKQLPMHTHGLDSSDLAVPPRTREGRLDLHELIEIVNKRKRIADPKDDLFSYGGAGSWISASLIEHSTDRPYASHVHEFFPTIRNKSHESCPAWGGGLKISALHLSEFVHYQFTDPRMTQLRKHSLEFPGWCPPRRAVCLGWYDQGGGWFGHNGFGPASGSIVRFNPEQQVGIVIVSLSERVAGHVLASLFRKVLPELSGWPRVDILGADEVLKTAWSNYAGEFENAAMKIKVEVGERKAPQMTVKFKHDLRPTRTFPLHPTRLSNSQFVFLLIPNEHPFHGFVQFVKPRADIGFEYIWDGRGLWRNTLSR